MSNHVLLVEDDRALRASVAQTLDLAGITVTEAGTYIEAKDHISADFEGVVLTDIRMPGKDGFDVLILARTRDEELPVIVLTGEGDIPMAVRAMNDGAHDFLTKPCPPDVLVKSLKQALELRKLALRARHLAKQLARGDIAAVNFPGPSESATRLRDELRRMAGLRVSVHIFGNEGSGKRIAAHSLHALSDSDGEFLAANCRELTSDKLEQLEQDSAGGTLCLRLLENASSEQQTMIHALIERAEETRIVTTSNAPLADLYPERLSSQLFYALDVATLFVPPLIERKEDLHLVFESFVRQASRSLNSPMPALLPEHKAEVAARDWPGNLPELRNFAQRVALGLETSENPTRATGLADRVEAFERALIIEGLTRNNGKAAATAQDLNLPRKTFYDKMKRHNLRPEDFK